MRSEDNGIVKIGGYRKDHNAETAERTIYSVYFSYDQYEIYNDKGLYISLYNRETGEKTFLAPIDYQDKIRVFDGYFTFYNDSSLYFFDLQTGKKSVYDINDYKELDSKAEFIKDYILVNDKVYISFNFTNHLIKIDLSSGKITCIKTSFSGKTIDFENLYSCGNRIFAMVSETSGKKADKKLVELEFSGSQINLKELGK